ncbi:hypothetical protein FOZ62_002819, partial [Perkinsus olseni]
SGGGTVLTWVSAEQRSRVSEDIQPHTVQQHGMNDFEEQGTGVPQHDIMHQCCQAASDANAVEVEEDGSAGPVVASTGRKNGLGYGASCKASTELAHGLGATGTDKMKPVSDISGAEGGGDRSSCIPQRNATEDGEDLRDYGVPQEQRPFGMRSQQHLFCRPAGLQQRYRSVNHHLEEITPYAKGDFVWISPEHSVRRWWSITASRGLPAHCGIDVLKRLDNSAMMGRSFTPYTNSYFSHRPVTT